MNWIERTIIFTIVIILGGVTAWMQSGLLEESEIDGQEQAKRHDPDYYIENFTAVGMDTEGRRQYVLEAERMVT